MMSSPTFGGGQTANRDSEEFSEAASGMEVRRRSNALLAAGALAVVVPPVVIALASEIGMAVYYLATCLVWVGVPQAVNAYVQQRLIRRPAKAWAVVPAAVASWIVGGAAAGALIPFFYGTRVQGAGLIAVAATGGLALSSIVVWPFFRSGRLAITARWAILALVLIVIVLSTVLVAST